MMCYNASVKNEKQWCVVTTPCVALYLSFVYIQLLISLPVEICKIQNINTIAKLWLLVVQIKNFKPIMNIS